MFLYLLALTVFGASLTKRQAEESAPLMTQTEAEPTEAIADATETLMEATESATETEDADDDEAIAESGASLVMSSIAVSALAWQ